MFIPGALLQHESQVVFVGRNVGGIYGVQFGTGFLDFFSSKFNERTMPSVRCLMTVGEKPQEPVY